MCVSRAFEMLDYLNEFPLADEILAAVYLDKSKRKSKSKRRETAPQNRDSALAQMSALSGTVGPGMGAAAQLPPQLREMARWALEQQKKMNNG